jgi:succinate-acetate transporter protein
LDKFLRDQKIALEGLLVEVHLDRFGSYMMLDACAAAGIEWEFDGTTPVRPAILSIRLTELTGGGADASAAAGRTAPPPTATGSGLANTTPAGLFAFSMANGLQCASKFYILFPGSLNESFILMWAPFMLFLGGLQFVAALFEVVRGNIYGCTAFMFFGVLWAGNGLTVLLQYSFASSDADASGGTGSIAPELVAMQNPWFAVVTDVYTLAFLLVLLVQTFAMNKVSTLVISLVSVKIFLSIFSPWSTGAVWAQFVAGWTTSAVAFYAFAAELANQIWHREMLPQHKWNVEKSPGEVFGAQGKIGTLQGRATQLRQAQYALSPLQLRVAAESEGDKDVGPASERPERTGTAAAPEGGSQQRLRTHRRFVSDPGSMFS